jgi:uncharacterized caspase-like protein
MTLRLFLNPVVLALLLALSLMASPVAAQTRHALVIGNDSYQALPRLAKARNDARAVGATLGGLGFAANVLEDIDRRSMTRALSTLASAIQPGDEVVFYFAGHGVEIGGRNYLLPVDAPAALPGDEAFLTAESVAVDDILHTLQSRGSKVTMLILDACRDNPFPRQGTRSAGGTRGLAPLAAPEGAFILFSAGTGQSALDTLSASDPDPNSVFTRALLPLLVAPGLPVQQMARALRAEVEATAQRVNHKQRPAYYDELTGDFILNTGATRGAVPLGASGSMTAPPPTPDPCQDAARDWQRVAAIADPVVLRAFAATHAGCDVFARAAEARAAELETARAITTPAPPPQPAAPVQTWRVKAGVSQGILNARASAGTMHPILFQIPARTGGLVMETCRKPDAGGGSFDWCLITWGSLQGWVSSNGLERE